MRQFVLNLSIEFNLNMFIAIRNVVHTMNINSIADMDLLTTLNSQRSRDKILQPFDDNGDVSR